MIQFERIIHYLLDILWLPQGELPARIDGKWGEMFKVADSLNIYHPIAAWILTSWRNNLPESLLYRINYDLKANEVRNALLSQQIIELANLFDKNSIRYIVIKGGAALMMDFFPPGWRFMSDIDILLKKNQAEDAYDLLKQRGYYTEEGTTARSQHLRGLRHINYAGEVELHTSPYPCLYFDDDNVIPSIRENASLHNFMDKEIAIPSVTDHVWILMRRKLLNQPMLPRLCDVIELALITGRGYKIDIDHLYRLARSENVSHLISGMSYACSEYGGMEPFAAMDIRLLRRWEAWSLKLRRKFINKNTIDSPRLRFVVITFISPKGFVPRLRFCLWLNMLIDHVDSFDYEVPAKPSYLLRFFRRIKETLTYLFTAAEYYVYYITKSLNH